MRILAIRFQNLNSLRGAHVVNLESGPLAEAGLFAITGPTGAGKSTILDAVTLALYGRAARYGRESAEDMMSRSAGECYAAVDFLSGTGRYTAKWLLRRARGKAEGKLQPVMHELSRDGKIIEEKTQRVMKRVEEITGLDYDRFLRSVLLAQGEFAAFLRASKDERADLLERITGSQIYSELGSLAYQISSGHSREIHDETIRMGAAMFMGEEERAEVSGRIAELANKLIVMEAEHAAMNARVTAARRALELQKQSEEHAAATQAHAKEYDAFAPHAARLARHAAMEPFAEALASLTDAERASASASAAHDDAVKKATAARAGAAHAAGVALAAIAAGTAAAEETQRLLTERRANISAEISVIRQWLDEHAGDASLTEQLPRLSVLAERAESLTARRDAAAKKLTESRTAAAKASAEWRTAQEKAAAAAEHSYNAAVSAKQASAILASLLVEPWTSISAVEKEVNRVANMVETLKRLTTTHSSLAAQEEKITALTAELLTLQSRVTALTESESQAREQLAAARREESLLQELVVREQRIRSMEEHRPHLQHGEPCPLCGSLDHPWAGAGALPEGDSAEQRLRRQKKTVRTLEKSAADAATALTGAGKSLAENQARRQAMAQALAAAGKSLAAEWHLISPNTECTAIALARATEETLATHSKWTALAQKAGAAHEQERAAMTAADLAAAEAKLALTGAGSASQNAAKAAAAVNEAEGILTDAESSLTIHLNGAKHAFAAFGESEITAFAEALQRLHARERSWRQTSQSFSDLEKKSVDMDHGQEKALLHIQTWSNRRRETGVTVRRAGIIAMTLPAMEAGWEEVNIVLTKNLTAFLTAENMAVSAGAGSLKAAERAAREAASLTIALGGSAFADIAELREAQLDPVSLKTLHAKRDALREAQVRLDAQREAIARDTEALMAGLRNRGEILFAGGETDDACSAEAPQRLAVAAGLAEMEETLAGLVRQMKSLQSERGAQQQRLTTDDETRARHAAAAAALEERKSAAAPWARLGQLIGSAAGDKFSRFAQSITLHHLTALANAQLVRLCDRYRLLRCGAAGDLDLQISDAWQADTARPLESLSGGECFLVSLALALGLSELAGRHTRIGTLFIDEGFGTLDSTALDIALSALEGLRTGHSTIGIISHVEALKSRLTTQVEVAPGPGGWSTLTVKT